MSRSLLSSCPFVQNTLDPLALQCELRMAVQIVVETSDRCYRALSLAIRALLQSISIATRNDLFCAARDWLQVDKASELDAQRAVMKTCRRAGSARRVRFSCNSRSSRGRRARSRNGSSRFCRISPFCSMRLRMIDVHLEARVSCFDA
jgi:hypothetical protein